MDFAYVNPIKLITDKDFYFKAKDEVTDNASSRFNESYAKAYAATIEKKIHLKDYDFRTGNKFYYSPSSNEYVNITYEKYNDYDYRDNKEMDEKIEKLIKSSTSLYLSNKKSSFNEGMYKYSCILKDTATVRAIDMRVFIKNGVMHEITSAYDTTIGMQGWARDFMDSFSPLDSVIGKNIFENKFSSLLNDLTSTDTLVKQRANTSITSVGVQKAYAEDFVKFISSDKINKVSEDSRAQLFVNGGTLESERIIEPYKKLYTQYTDSFYLQLCLLKGMAYLKTQTARNEFYNLLMSEPPLVGADNTVSDVFEVLHDSMELCKVLPGMLTLTKYDEYKDAVYSLMAEMVNKKLIPSTVYASQRESILLDANLALKRYTPASSKAKTSGDEGILIILKRLHVSWPKVSKEVSMVYLTIIFTKVQGI